MPNPSVEQAILIIAPVAQTLFASSETHPLPVEFKLGKHTLSLTYQPERYIFFPVSGRMDCFDWNATLTITQSETKFGIDNPRGDTLYPNEIARRQLEIIKILDQNEIKIKSNSATRKEFEGHGLGSALISLQDEFIADLIRRYPERFTGNEITAYMYDLSEKRNTNGPQKFTRWTSYWAERLGYTHSGPAWEKKYQ
jgi:hypothetical protein